ncbi:hypothetical protein F4815DRAFT_455840 [Daldinia loculata]|nr:hypothetical protein F4815DRAFT_455840 [Daldinia loculata]
MRSRLWLAKAGADLLFNLGIPPAAGLLLLYGSVLSRDALLLHMYDVRRGEICKEILSLTHARRASWHSGTDAGGESEKPQA